MRRLLSLLILVAASPAPAASFTVEQTGRHYYTLAGAVNAIGDGTATTDPLGSLAERAGRRLERQSRGNLRHRIGHRIDTLLKVDAGPPSFFAKVKEKLRYYAGRARARARTFG